MYFQNRKRFNVVVQKSKFYNFYSISFEGLAVFDRPIFYSKYICSVLSFSNISLEVLYLVLGHLNFPFH